ncbi:tyrosyl-DNA phosphodiesterase 2 isoform X4 [Pseudophryne corroboree]|uniref:tyrosyl-DNA phosphodiesterase 2 isoform X4 n=1 Tax=Pseudophryne corroboree TaxID=495146 RepID=UPI003081C8C4
MEGDREKAALEPGNSDSALISEREQRCAEFASIAGCDLAVAQCYLAENDWELERAVNSYFEPEVESLPQEQPLTNATHPSEEQAMSSSTWYSPDIIFLQEVIHPYFEYLKKRAVSYTIITGNDDGYFTAIMLKKSRVKLISQEIVPFPNTSMMRNLLIVNVNICGNNICLMTSHLESTKDHSKERVSQLHIVLKKMQEIPPATTVIFGGDTNLRDKEVEKIGGLPSNILDVWEFLGKPEHCRYTWDTKINNNLQIPYTSRLRFDRILYRAAVNGSQVVPQSLDLIGTEKLDCGRFPSDHWGLLCDFDVIL